MAVRMSTIGGMRGAAMGSPQFSISGVSFAVRRGGGVGQRIARGARGLHNVGAVVFGTNSNPSAVVKIAGTIKNNGNAAGDARATLGVYNIAKGIFDGLIREASTIVISVPPFGATKSFILSVDVKELDMPGDFAAIAKGWTGASGGSVFGSVDSGKLGTIGGQAIFLFSAGTTTIT